MDPALSISIETSGPTLSSWITGRLRFAPGRRLPCQDVTRRGLHANWFAAGFNRGFLAELHARGVMSCDIAKGHGGSERDAAPGIAAAQDRKSTRLNSSHRTISYAVFRL